MNGRPDGPSPALLAAQRRLEEARKSHQRSAGSGRRPAGSGQSSAASGQSSAVSRQLSAVSRQLSATSDQPPTTSDQSPVTNHQPPATSNQPPATSNQPPIPDPQSPNIHPSSFTLHPSLALAMLGQGLTASGRIWLLLRHIDREGRGWLYVDQVQGQLCRKGSSLRVCGQRQLRNLLRQGQDIFWLRDKDRLWLNSAARVAVALGVERLRGRPVSLPLPVLLGGIGQVRAHFYASFHSGRPATGKEEFAAPINRATLAQITHVPARTQRLYEQRAGVRCQANIAVGERMNQHNLQERAWRHGRATFLFIDHEGKQGPAGGRYVAWRLPNSYQGPHATSPKGRIKKINRQIDLVHSRAQGNDLDRPGAVDRLFHTNGREAGQDYNRDQSHDIYWPGRRPRDGRRRLWRVLPAKGG